LSTFSYAKSIISAQNSIYSEPEVVLNIKEHMHE